MRTVKYIWYRKVNSLINKRGKHSRKEYYTNTVWTRSAPNAESSYRSWENRSSNSGIMLGKYERASRSEETAFPFPPTRTGERDILTRRYRPSVPRTALYIATTSQHNADREGAQINLRNERWGCTLVELRAYARGEFARTRACRSTWLLCKIMLITHNRVKFLDLSLSHCQILSTNIHSGIAQSQNS